MIDSDIAYFQRRLEEEERRASQSEDPIAAGAHRQLASLYAEKLAGRPDQSLANPQPPSAA